LPVYIPQKFEKKTLVIAALVDVKSLIGWADPGFLVPCSDLFSKTQNKKIRAWE
jgi:hypothetical protein